MTLWNLPLKRGGCFARLRASGRGSACSMRVRAHPFQGEGAAALLTRGLRFGMPDMPGTLPFRDVVIAAGVIGHGAMMIAVCGAVGAGEISHRIGEIGVGIAQPFRRSGVAKA